MSDDAYRLLLQQFQQLTRDEQMQMLVDLVALISRNQQSAPELKRSILELEGLGIGTWEGIDVDQYINEERDSWERDLHNDTKG